MKELANIDAVNLLVAVVVALAGMYFHYYKMWLRGQTKSTLVSYMFGKKAYKATINATIVVLGAVLTMFASNMISVDTINGLLAIFTLGYTGDSVLNRDNLTPA